jgi:hypothetical protein
MAYRFWGEVPAWPPSWDNTGTDVYVQVEVAGITRRLGLPGTASLGSALNEYYTTLTGASAPVAYWPCDDQEGSVTFSSDVPNIAPMQFSGAPQLASDSEFGGSLPLPVLNGSIWYGTLGATSLASTANTRVFTPGTTTWTAPVGTGQVTVEAWAGGAGGAAAGGNGGGGGQFAGDTLEVTAGSVYPVIVGSGGAGSTTPTGTGAPGGLTSFAGNSFIVTANGGSGGTPSDDGTGGTGGGSVASDGSGSTSPNAVSFDGGRGGDNSNGAAGNIGTNGSLVVANSTDPNNGNWTAPSTINSQVIAHAWGSGGGGGGGIGGGSQHAGGGGGGGNFGTLGITVVPGNNYTVTAGAGGVGGQPGFNGGNGSASGFTGAATTLTIHGGFGGESGSGGGTGGAPSGDAQAATFGGSGAAGITTTGGGGGGGASGATPGGNGGTATGRGGGAGGAAGGSDVAGGAGGSGGNPGVAGGNGSGPGGGGAASGGASTGHGGTGADGRVELFWTNAVPQTASGGGAGGSSGGTAASGMDGAAGSGATGGINTAPPSGAGAGGNGGSGTGSFNGLAGAVPGGGGGAGGSFTNSVTNVTTNGNGAAGANGQLVLSWTTTTVVGGGSGATAAANTLRFLMQVPLAGDVTGAVIASMLTTGTITEVDVIYLSGGALQLRGFSGGTVAFDSGPLAFGVNGNPVLVSAELVQNGASITWEIATSTLGAGSVAIGTSGSIAGSVSSVTGVIINPSGGLQGTSVGQVTVQYTDTDLAAVAAAASGYAGETAAARFTRLCAQNNVPSVVLGDPGQTVLMGSQQPDTLSNLLQSCEDADRGQLFEPRDQFGLGYRTRVDLSNQAAGAALDYSLGQLVAPLSPTDDDQLIANDVTVQRAGGSSHEVALLTGALSVQVPPNGVNKYAKSYTEVLYNDGQLPSAAGWLLSLGTVNQQRFPSISVNLTRPADIGVFNPVVATDIGDLLTIANPPAWMPPELIQQLLVGWTETLGPYTWTIAWNCVPAIPYFTGVLGDPLFGQPDTDGSQLVNAVSSSATSLLIAPTATGYPLWTTASSDFPFDVIMAGERMTVTKVTGTSASGQVFTVVRSVNGIVTAQAAGAAVNLFYPLIEGM